MALRLYDSLRRELRPLTAAQADGVFRFYNCGPTVYAPAHIGNFRTFVVNDLIRRLADRQFGPGRVKHVRNLTDVDDKTIRRAREERRPLADVTRQWTEKFHRDCAALNCLPPHVEPTATGHIPEQIDMIAALERQLAVLPRKEIAGASWRDFGCVIVCESLAGAIPLVDRIAPEHLEIMSADADELTQKVRNAGAIFVGGHTPEAIGDYVGGSNHVLPTARSARFSSGLGVLDFMKRTSILKCTPDALRELGPAAIALGEAESLDAHARSVAIRMNLG